MRNKIIIFSGKQYSGKDTAAKILMEAMPEFRRCAMGDIIKLEYAKEHTSLPDVPDYKRINDFKMYVNERIVRGDV